MHLSVDKGLKGCWLGCFHGVGTMVICDNAAPYPPPISNSHANSDMALIREKPLSASTFTHLDQVGSQVYGRSGA